MVDIWNDPARRNPMGMMDMIMMRWSGSDEEQRKALAVGMTLIGRWWTGRIPASRYVRECNAALRQYQSTPTALERAILHGTLRPSRDGGAVWLWLAQREGISSHGMGAEEKGRFIRDSEAALLANGFPLD